MEQTIRDFWVTRPARRANDRKVSGVAAALGRRYRIDPVLVRVAFVVATLFSGVGVLLYLLGWLLLPAEGDEVSAAEGLLGRRHSSVSPVLTVVLGLALIPAASAVFDDAYGVLGLAAAAAGLFFLHRSRAALGEIPMAASTAGGPTAPIQPSSGVAGSGAEATTSTASPAPPSWDPLGAAPFAWDLPEPAPIPPPAAPPPGPFQSKVTPFTLGLALLASGITAAFALPVAQIVAIALAILGLGMVVGSVLRGGRGLIAFALPLALLTWVLQAIPDSDVTIGERRWAPTTVEQVQPRYDLTMGNGVLDLTGLQVADGQTVTTGAWVGVGEMRVLLPPNLDAQMTCHASMGDANCLDRISSGIPAELDGSDPGSDGPGGGKLVLDVRAGAGNITVDRR